MGTADEVATDRGGLEVLGFETCLELAGSVPIGRVGFVDGGEVIVLPVTHVLDEDGVAFRVASGSKLDAAIMERTMSFEVDDYDSDGRTGWSVLVRGTATYVDDPQRVARLEGRRVEPWTSPDERTEWVVIRPSTVTGRRIV